MTRTEALSAAKPRIPVGKQLMGGAGPCLGLGGWSPEEVMFKQRLVGGAGRGWVKSGRLGESLGRGRS